MSACSLVSGGSPAIFCIFLFLGSFSSCRPEFGDSPTRIEKLRILAVTADPPEVTPGSEITLKIVAGNSEGTVRVDNASWSFCAAPKPLDENGTVSPACTGPSGLRMIEGTSDTVRALVPKDACSLFGSDAPPGGFRPRDPDTTGGFYQPMRVAFGDVLAFPLVRVRCNLARAPVDVARAFAADYVPNRNPRLGPLIARINGAATDLAALPAGRTIDLETSWPAEVAESYIAFDAASQSLTTRREEMRVSWFATDGLLASERTGRNEGDFATSTENRFTAPSTPGIVHIWVVLRDSRGGSTFAVYDARITP
jgi:hypothetical protein